MKIKFIALGVLILVISGCCEKQKNNITTQLKVTKQKLESCVNNNYSNFYIPKQKNRAIRTNERGNLRNLNPNNKFNSFNCKKGFLYLKIPVTNEYMTIVDIIDVSTKKINAFIVLIDGNEGDSTEGQYLTHFIESKATISKITDYKNYIKSEKDKIKVIVVHDNEFYSDNLRHLIELQIIEADSDYGTIITLPKKKIKGMNVPRELEDDIINGGGPR